MVLLAALARSLCSRVLWSQAVGGLLILLAYDLTAQPFLFPTANHALLTPGQEEKFYVGTVGKPWSTGTFGCVRNYGHQVHEGLDIRCLTRDRRGEPTDSVTATAEGTVTYINAKPGLSNYGNYIVLRHVIEGVEIYSLYAHLREIRNGLRVGQSVKAGEIIAIMGRTTNTHEGISKERAHVHFELDLLVNDRFATWYKKALPGQRNDHGEWNGQNLVGIDPRVLLLEQKNLGPKFSLVAFLKNRTELCRVLVRKTDFPWPKRYQSLVRPNPTQAGHPVVGYELALDFNGVPFELIPRSPSEINPRNAYQLLSVNESEFHKNPARQFVTRTGNRWKLAEHGVRYLDLLTY